MFDDTDIDFAALMEEPPGGHNAGRIAIADEFAPKQDMGTDATVAAEFMDAGGFSIVNTEHGHGSGATYGARDLGMTAHRGIVHPDEYIDRRALRLQGEMELGFSTKEVHAVYKTGGRIPNNLRQQRDAIDARLLALSSAGANMAALARLFELDWVVITRALARAKAATS